MARGREEEGRRTERRETMLPYGSQVEAEAALGRALTAADVLWFSYTARMPDFVLWVHNIIFVFVIYTLTPLPLALLEIKGFKFLDRYKLQPNARLSPAEFRRCYVQVMRLYLLVVVPLQIFSFQTIMFVGIRTGLPLPSLREIFCQLLVYFLVEDYGNYWMHRFMHRCKWAYEKIHSVHHEFTAPVGFAAPYAHWMELLLVGIPSFVGPAIVPGHMITFLLWIMLRQMEAIDIHSGYDFPFSPTKYIPFYGGAEYHDYHHYVGGQSNSNFASVFTFCDYIYGTDKGYRYQKACIKKMREGCGYGQLAKAAKFE